MATNTLDPKNPVLAEHHRHAAAGRETVDDDDSDDDGGSQKSTSRTPVLVVQTAQNPDKTACPVSILWCGVIVTVVCLVIGIIIKCYLSSHGSKTSHYDFNQSFSQNYGPSSSSDVSLSQDLNARCNDKVCKDTVRDILSYLNVSVDPCEDFYNFACQGWQKENPRPNYEYEWSGFSVMEKDSNDIIIDILKEPISRGIEIQAVVQAKDYFQKCMDIEQEKAAPDQDNKAMQLIVDTLEKYGGWPLLYEYGTWNSSNFNMLKSIADLRRKFDSTYILDITPYPVGKAGRDNPIVISRPTSSSTDEILLKLPPAPENGAIKKIFTYKDFIVNTIMSIARELLHFKGVQNVNETHLELQALVIRQIKMDIQTADEIKNRRKMLGYKNNVFNSSLSDLQRLLDFHGIVDENKLDLKNLLNLLFAGTNIQIRDQKVLADLDYLLGVSMFLSETKVEEIANYLHFQMVFKMLSMVASSKLQELQESFERSLYGTTDPMPRKYMCAELVQKKFALALSRQYVLRITSNDDTSDQKIQQVQKLFKSVRQSFSTIINSSKELGYTARRNLGLKLLRTDFCPGYPSWIFRKSMVQKEYADLNLTGSNFFEQTMALSEWTAVNKLRKLGKPKTLYECLWTRFVGKTSPYFEFHSVYVPLGMIRAPFLDVNMPMSIIYGKLGSSIGHELAHGLVGKGWTEYKSGAMTTLSKCLADYYSNYTFDELNDENATLDGHYTLEENISDLAGIMAAYSAFRKDFLLNRRDKTHGTDKYTEKQLFYLGFAQIWCSSSTLEVKRLSLSNSKHSPGRFRVLGTLQNSEDFAEAWKCPLGSNMNPLKKCKIF